MKSTYLYIVLDPQNLNTYDVYYFMRGNPTLEIDKGERPPFSYKRGPLPLDLEEKKKRETMGLHYQRVEGPNDP